MAIVIYFVSVLELRVVQDQIIMMMLLSVVSALLSTSHCRRPYYPRHHHDHQHPSPASSCRHCYSAPAALALNKNLASPSVSYSIGHRAAAIRQLRRRTGEHSFSGTALSVVTSAAATITGTASQILVRRLFLRALGLIYLVAFAGALGGLRPVLISA